MNFAPHLYTELLPENLYGHRQKVEYLRSSIDTLRSAERPNLRILDAGCGSGYAVTRFLPRRGDCVLGLDMYQPSIDFALSNYGCAELQFICANLEDLPESEGEYDVVVLADVLEHLEDPFSVLSAAVARLAPDGLLLASVPNGRGPFEIESAISRASGIGPLLLRSVDLFVAALNKTILRDVWSRHIAETAPPKLPYNAESGHLQFFTKSRFVALLSSAGLDIRGMKSVSFISGPFSNSVIAPSRNFCSWNVRVAKRLPLWAVSAWYVECGLGAQTGHGR